MGYHQRIESADVASFQTTRTRNSELWFINNPDLEGAILGYTARYVTRHEIKLYALAIEGNHTQFVAHFPLANRANFMRDFNSSIARAVIRYQTNYPGGGLWARRYSAEYLPGEQDIENLFFYTVLQPVNDGLVNDIRDYPDYNCFEDAINGVTRKYKVVKWKEYNDARRWNKDVSIDDFTEICTLTYARLPGYEHLTQSEYATHMRRKLKKRTEDIIRKRKGKPSMGAKRLKLLKPGARPIKTKTSGRKDHRPRVLSNNHQRRSSGETWYFEIFFRYKKASKCYRSGEPNVKFPKGTYKPPLFTVAHTGGISLH
jgi:hypothetical protein